MTYAQPEEFSSLCGWLKEFFRLSLLALNFLNHVMKLCSSIVFQTFSGPDLRQQATTNCKHRPACVTSVLETWRNWCLVGPKLKMDTVPSLFKQVYVLTPALYHEPASSCFLCTLGGSISVPLMYLNPIVHCFNCVFGPYQLQREIFTVYLQLLNICSVCSPPSKRLKFVKWLEIFLQMNTNAKLNNNCSRQVQCCFAIISSNSSRAENLRSGPSLRRVAHPLNQGSEGVVILERKVQLDGFTECV